MAWRVTTHWRAPSGTGVRVCIRLRGSYTLVGTGAALSLRRVVGACGWSGLMVCGTCMMPGVLLRVTRRCMRGICINDRFAVVLQDCMMGGASVMRGTVMIG